MSEKIKILYQLSSEHLGDHYRLFAIPPIPQQNIMISPHLADIYNEAAIEFTNNRTDNALSLFLRFTQIYPQSAIGWGALGEVYGRQQKFSEAMDAFQKAITLFPEYLEGYSGIGALYGIQGQYDLAFEQFLKIFQIYPLAIDYYDKIGTYLRTNTVKSENFDHPLQVYSLAVKAWPNQGYFWMYRALCLVALGQFVEAQNNCLYALQFQSSLAPYLLALIYEVRGQLEKAAYTLQSYRKILEKMPPVIAEAIPIDLERLKNLALDKGITIPEKYDEIPWPEHGKAQESIDACIHCLEIVPEHVKGWLELSRSYTAIKDWKAALKSALTALKFVEKQSSFDLRVQKETLLGDIGRCYMQLGMLTNALATMQKSLKFPDKLPETAFRWNSLAEIQVRMGKYPEAEISIQNALEIMPNTIAHKILFTQILLKQGKLDAVRNIVHNWQGLDQSKDPYLLNKVGEFYRDIGDKEKASELFQKSIAHDSRRTWGAQKNLDNLVS